MDDVKEWTGLSLNETRRDPEARVVWRKRVSRVGLNSLSQDFKKPVTNLKINPVSRFALVSGLRV